jgi:hypothetical protein
MKAQDCTDSVQYRVWCNKDLCLRSGDRLRVSDSDKLGKMAVVARTGRGGSAAHDFGRWQTVGGGSVSGAHRQET